MNKAKQPSLQKSENSGRISKLTIVILVIVLAFILSVSTGTFFSYSNLYSILFGVSIQFFALIGFTYLMIMGEIDLSVGALYGFGGALLGVLMIVLKIPFVPALVLTLIVAVLIGFINGYLVVRFRINSLMVTLGMMSIAKGLTSALSTSLGAAIFPSVYRDLIKIRLLDIHWSIIAFIIIVIVLEILLYKTSVFKKLYYVGNNIETAKIYGIKAGRIKVIAFIVSAVLAVFGGILATSRITHAYPTTGEGLEFTFVTAAVLGGASLYGGKGSILRSALGLLFIAIMQNGMIIYKIDPYFQTVVLGLILIVAVFVDTSLNKKRA